MRCAALEAVPGIAHGFGTRDPAPGLTQAAGLSGAAPASLRQVHGREIVSLDEPIPGTMEADGAFLLRRSEAPTIVPAVRTADCVPVLMSAADGRAVAAIHAGWRGTAAGIARSAVSRFEAAGIPCRELIVALGPAISGCCYEVGPEVPAALAASGARSAEVGPTGEGRALVDLRAALREQLASAGVPDGSIHYAPWCTRCRADLFHSYRADGQNAGRMIAVIGPAGP